MPNHLDSELELAQLLETYKKSETSTWNRRRTSQELSGFVNRRIEALGDIDLV